MLKMTVAVVIPLVAAISLKWLPYPFVWIFGCASLVSFLQFRYAKAIKAVIWFNIGSILLILASLEIALEVVKPSTPVGHYLWDSRPDPVLGYKLIPDSQRRAWLVHEGDTLFDVTYTVDQDGLRVSPLCSGACESSILFFGGSLTYGEGVNDQETMPYQVGVRAHGRYAVYNFGVHGYGPNHMLALIESGKVSARVDQAPEFAIYQAILPEHVYRVAGLRPWLRQSPKYVLDSGGQVSRSGRFSDDDLDLPFWPVIRRNLNRSALGNRSLNDRRPIGAKDDDLFVAIVANAAHRLKDLYPGIEVHMVVWGDPMHAAVSRLEGEGISVHSADSILQANSITGNAAKLGDGHPTPLAHASVADHVVRRILKLGEASND